MATPYPFDRLPRLSRREARVVSTVARWLDAHEAGAQLSKLVGPVRARVVRVSEASNQPPVARPAATPIALDGTLPMSPTSLRASRAAPLPTSGVEPLRGSDGELALHLDEHAAWCELRVAGASITIGAASLGVRRIGQKLLGGLPELAAPRPLTEVERSLWALVVAAALEDFSIAGEVWPRLEEVGAGSGAAIECVVELLGIAMTVVAQIPDELELRVPPARVPAWAERAVTTGAFVVGRCAIEKTALDALAVRDVITLDRAFAALPTVELCVLGGGLGLRATPGAIVAEVASGYVPHSMSLPDDAHVELTVGLGTTQLTLRQVFELAVGAVVPLGRPLAGPFELRAAGQVVGEGELVDVDGELGVRVTRLTK